MNGVASLPSTCEEERHTAARLAATDLHRALTHADRAVDCAEHPDHPGLARALLVRAGILGSLGRLDEAEEDCRRGLDAAADAPAVRGRLHVKLGVYAIRRGEYQRGFDELHQALLDAHEAGDQHLDGRVQAHLLGLFPGRGPDEVVHRLRDLLAVVPRPAVPDHHLGEEGSTQQRMVMLGYMLGAELAAGRPAAAREVLRELDVEAAGAYEVRRRCMGVRILMAEQRHEDAVAELRELVVEAERVGERLDQLWATATLAACLNGRGDHHRARDLLDSIDVDIDRFPALLQGHLTARIDAQRGCGDFAAAYGTLQRLRSHQENVAAARQFSASALEMMVEVRRAGGDLARVRGEADTLAELADDLERRVEERTHELTEALERLGWLANEYRLLAENTADIVARLSAEGEVLFVSPSVRRVLGIEPADLLGTDVGDLVVAEDRAMLRERLDWARRSSRAVSEEVRLGPCGVVVEGDAPPLWMEVTFTPVAGQTSGDSAVHMVARDVSRRRLAEEELVARSFSDHLTGLPNRAHLRRYLFAMVNRAITSDLPFALLFLDVDRFKLVNDSRGHAFGDALLQEMSRRLTDSLRAGEFLARFGGDEFVVVVPGAQVDEAIQRAEDIRSGVEVPWEPGELVMVPSLSVGVVCGDGRSDPDELLRDADTALYRAKEQGRGRVEVYGVRLRAEADRHFETEQLLRRALEHGWVRVYLQPIVWAESRVLAGAEALVRIDHPEAGLLLPGRFLEVAEESGLIAAMGAQVLDEVERLVDAWEAEGRAIPLAINVGVRELMAPGAVERIAGSAVTRRGLLNIELNEGLLIDAQGPVNRLVDQLREAGVRIVLDDFGAAYSSITNLRELPVQEVKIDRSFTATLGGEAADTAVVRAIVDLARAFDCLTVVEGVENAIQAEVALELGCDLLQGYHIAAPMPPEEFGRQWLSTVPVAAANASFPSLEPRA